MYITDTNNLKSTKVQSNNSYLQSIAKKNQHSLPIQTPESYKVISLATSIIHPVISAFNNAVTSSSKHYVVTLTLNLLSFRCLQSYQVFSYAQIYHFFSAARSRKKTTTSGKQATTLIVQTKCIVTIGARDLFAIPCLPTYGST